MLILSGGGAHPKTKKTIDWLSNTYERLRVLYVPQARESDNNYSECIEWLIEELDNPQYAQNERLGFPTYNIPRRLYWYEKSFLLQKQISGTFFYE